MKRSLLVLLCFAGPAFAQVDLVDPDVKPKKAAKPAPAEEEEEAPPDDEAEAEPAAEPTIKPKRAEPQKKPEPAPAPAARPLPLALVVTHVTDADLDAAWERWRVANAESNTKAENAARVELLRLREEIGAGDLEIWATAMLRSAAQHEAAGSSSVAIEQAQAAVQLAPHLPSSHFGLAREYFASDPSEIGRYFGALVDGVSRLVVEPRYQRPLLADAGAALLAALVITGVLVTFVLFLRRARYFLFDVHFFFPDAVARWQTAAMGLALLSLPIVFRLGLVPILLTGLFAVALYSKLSERVVVAVLISLIGLVPIAAGMLVRFTAFADTPAEAAWKLERGGVGAEAVAATVAKAATEDKAAFGELFALGTFELHRGKLELAIPHLQAALQKTPDEPRAEVNLGVAMMLRGDLENPGALFQAAAAKLPEREAAVAWFDLARYYQRRVATFGGDVAASDLDKGSAALSEARARDAALASRPDDKLDGNVFLAALPMARTDLVALCDSPESEARVTSQLSAMLLGDLRASWAPLYPLIACLLLVGFGGLSMRLRAARECTKCGRPMSTRGDREQTVAGALCTQCVNVYSKKGVVPPAVKVRKQAEVIRHRVRSERAVVALGLVCSGMGHVFKGLPVRGAVYAFLFVSAAVALALRDGVLRTSFEGLPPWVKLVPLGLLLVGVYGLSVRNLLKQGPVT